MLNLSVTTAIANLNTTYDNGTMEQTIYTTVSREPWGQMINTTDGKGPLEQMINTTDDKRPIEQMIVIDFRQWYQHGFEYILDGYVIPIWTIIIICTYSLMVYVFLKHGMTTKSHLCLIAIAVCDSLTPVCPSIMRFYFFAVRGHFYYLPLEWCRAFHYMTEICPRIFSCTSTYLTILLAMQRYIAVGHPFKVDRLCTKRTIKTGICICVVITLAIKAIYFVHYDYIGITVPAFKENGTMQACAVKAPKWLHIPFFEYLGINQAVFTFVYHITSCALLMVFEILLVCALRKSAASRKNMASNTAVSKRRKKEIKITHSTLAITFVALVYGLCASFTHVLDFIHYVLGVNVINNNDIRSIVTSFNILYYVMLPSNFIVTCCLSEDFRNHLEDVLSEISKALQMLNPLTCLRRVHSSVKGVTKSTSYNVSDVTIETRVA